MIATVERIFWKIRRKSTGLFSTGGQYPGWRTKGKEWRTRGALTSHMQLALARYSEIAGDIELVECLAVLTETSVLDGFDVVWDFQLKRAELERQRKEVGARAAVRRAKEDLERAQARASELGLSK